MPTSSPVYSSGNQIVPMECTVCGQIEAVRVLETEQFVRGFGKWEERFFALLANAVDPLVAMNPVAAKKCPHCGDPRSFGSFFRCYSDYQKLNARYVHQFLLSQPVTSMHTSPVQDLDKGESDDFKLADEASERMRQVRLGAKGTKSIAYWQGVLRKRGLM